MLSQSEYESDGQSGELKHDLVNVAPAPVFTRLFGTNDRMFRGMIVLRRVLVPRGIAATDVPARPAKAKVHPTIAHLCAFFAPPGMGLHGLNLVDVRALSHDLDLCLGITAERDEGWTLVLLFSLAFYRLRL